VQGYEVKKLKEVKEKDKQKEEKISQPGQIPAAPASVEGERAWSLAIGELQRQMPRSEFESWIRPARYIGYVDGVFTVSVANRYAADRLEKRVSAELRNQLRGIVGRDVSISYVVDGAQPSMAQRPAVINSS
jgi:hypothetical protein